MYTSEKCLSLLTALALGFAGCASSEPGSPGTVRRDSGVRRIDSGVAPVDSGSTTLPTFTNPTFTSLDAGPRADAGAVVPTIIRRDAAVQPDSGPTVSLPPQVTYYEHLRPVLTERCVNCHAAGGLAPFALETYQ